MQGTILQEGQPIGTVHIHTTHTGFDLLAQCRNTQEGILRLGAQNAQGERINFGVLEPIEDAHSLGLQRKYTQSWLTAHGFTTMPTQFFVYDATQTQTVPQTGDALLDQKIAQHGAICQQQERDIVVQIPWRAGEQTPFAFCLLGCEIKNKQAVLVIQRNNG